MAMLMKLEFEIVYTNGGRDTVGTRPATEVAYERKFGVSMAKQFMGAPIDGIDLDTGATVGASDLPALMAWFGENIKAESTYFMAWHAARIATPFDEWIETVESIEWKFAGRVDPTSPAPSAS